MSISGLGTNCALWQRQVEAALHRGGPHSVRPTLRWFDALKKTAARRFEHVVPVTVTSFFPGSAWERAAVEALPRRFGAWTAMSLDGRRRARVPSLTLRATQPRPVARSVSEGTAPPYAPQPFVKSAIRNPQSEICRAR